MKRGRQGFTLMEMLIVVAIIAVLVAIAVPAFSSRMEAARQKADVADAKNVETALKAYYLTDSGGPDGLKNEKLWGNYDVGYVFVNQDGARCSGNAHLALIAAGIGKKSDWTYQKSRGEYWSSALKCQTKKEWVKYQVQFQLDKNGNIVFTSCASNNMGSGIRGNTEAFSKALCLTYDPKMSLGEAKN